MAQWSEPSPVLRLGRAVLDLVLPARCPVTGERVAFAGALSPTAWQAMRFIQQPLCACCGMPLPDIGEGGTSEHGDPAQTVPVSSVQQCGACLEEPPAFDRARAAVAYEESSRQLILGFKHGQKIHLAHSFAYALLQRHGAMIAEADYIVPVPLHRWRLFRRGYNQAALIARLLAKESGRPALIEGLRRIRATKPQQGAAAARALNIKGAFAVGRLPPDFAGKRVLLVDDVLTTGATVEACARVLRGAGAGYVDVLCFARVIR